MNNTKSSWLSRKRLTGNKKKTNKTTGGNTPDPNLERQVQLSEPNSKIKVDNEGDTDLEHKVNKLRTKVETEDAIRL